MAELFDKVLELSWQAGVMALAVMVVRLVLRKRASRRAVCLLWALVALRLVLPVSLSVESPVSLQAEEAPVSRMYHEIRQAEAVIPPAAGADSTAADTGTAAAAPAAAAEQRFSIAGALPWVWLTGMSGMVLYMAASFLWMRLALRRSVRIGGNVYRCRRWNTPFVLGIFAPRIYVPEKVPQEDLPQVLTHERCHIRRGDHVWKPLAFVLLAVHWFNPVLWAAYFLLGRDMENACDEMALRNADTAQRAAYSRALVSCAARPRMAAVSPLAFGEVAVKERVKNVIHYRKPAVWAILLLILAAAGIAVCLLTKPAQQERSKAERLYAMRTAYVGDNAAVGAILDALGVSAGGATREGETYTYSLSITSDREPYGVTVVFGHDQLPERDAAWDRQMAQRAYTALALIDNIEWFGWTEAAQAAKGNGGIVYAGDYVDELNAARQSVEGLQAYLDLLQAKAEDGSLVYYPEDALPTFTEQDALTWSVTGDNDPRSVRAEDYGIVYDWEHLPDWDTVPLSYLCAYVLNSDGAYTEAAMDTLVVRFHQAGGLVTDYFASLAGQAAPNGQGDAAEVLNRMLKLDLEARYGTPAASGTEEGTPFTAVFVKDQLKISVTDVYDKSYVTVRYDENLSEDIPVYTVGGKAVLSVAKGEGFTLYGRYSSENVALHDGDVIDLTEQFVGLGMDGLHNVQFRHRPAEPAAANATLSFNDNGAGMTDYPAAWYIGSGYSICILQDGWQRLTLKSGWNDPAVDGSPALGGYPAEVWQSTEDTNARLYVAHLGGMTLKEAQDWARDTGGGAFTLSESKQGDISGTGRNGAVELYRQYSFFASNTERFAVVKEYPTAKTEHLGYALNAMADTFVLH